MIYLPTFDSVSLSGDDFENLCDPGKIKHSRVDNRLEKGRHATCDPACFDTEIFFDTEISIWSVGQSRRYDLRTISLQKKCSVAM